jgi:hypothetical protein
LHWKWSMAKTKANPDLNESKGVQELKVKAKSPKSVKKLSVEQALAKQRKIAKAATKATSTNKTLA